MVRTTAIMLVWFVWLIPWNRLESAEAMIVADKLGVGLNVGLGVIDGRPASGIGVTVALVSSYSLETKQRGIAYGCLEAQAALEVWGLRPGDLYTLDVSGLWLPWSTDSRLRPYVGLGGGVGNAYNETSAGTANTGPQAKVSGICGVSYSAGWDESLGMKTMWFIEVRAGQYVGSISGSEIIMRQGILWRI